jgi:hypothetical protein
MEYVIRVRKIERKYEEDTFISELESHSQFDNLVCELFDLDMPIILKLLVLKTNL